jgi:hypothetical protein
VLHRTLWACAVVLCCLGSSADAAGIQLVNGPTLSGAIWYPCQAESKHVELGDLAIAFDYGQSA